MYQLFTRTRFPLEPVPQACGTKEGDVLLPNPQNVIPVVKADSSYEVLLEEDVVYAEGLSHESLNSANATRVPLKLDIYTPNNELENRPAVDLPKNKTNTNYQFSPFLYLQRVGVYFH